VSVPDGGPVLLGGLKTLSEGRNKFGPPILSKIPYVNRLFKNVGYCREAQSLLIMVMPRPGATGSRASGIAPGPKPALPWYWLLLVFLRAGKGVEHATGSADP
jgi:hypothetical protein